MDYVILDLEWNGSYSRKKKGYVNEIIEFGAVKCNENMQELDHFKCYVKPQITKKISSVITDLTRITDEKLVNGVPFMRAVSLFRKWCGDAVVVTWGMSDILALIENCAYYSHSAKVPFLHRHCDMQQYVQAELGLAGADQLGLLHAAELLQLEIDESKLHRALDDSRISLAIFQKLYSAERIIPFIMECDDEFYNRVTFKTEYIIDLEDPLVQKTHLRFSCPKCAGKCKRLTQWKLKNKSFRAEFRCNECGYAFTGRLTIKQKYKELSVNKKTFPTPHIESPRTIEPGMQNEMRLEKTENGVGLLRFPVLCEAPVRHAFSTRIGGISENEFAAMNLGFGRGDTDANVEENYRIFAEAIGVDPQSFVAGAQDHHTNIRKVDIADCGIGIWKPKDMDSIDGLCTNSAGVTLVIYCADCVPLYYYDRVKHVIGLAHAGWKGTAAGMAAEMVKKLRAEYGCAPQDLTVCIGPSISREGFEVDAPVAEIFSALPEHETFVEDTGNNKFHIDLWECNRRFLLQTGVPSEQIHIGGVCTMQNSDLIFSHRKTQGKRGSNCAVLALQPIK